MDRNLIDYFENNWKPDYNKFKYSGWKVLESIPNNATVLDVGCGYNLFKPYLKERLWGIDPANDAADERVGIEDFKTDNQWDIILCLGSINFGNKKNIDKQIECVVKSCRNAGKIFWRQNPGLNDHQWSNSNNIDFFPWSFEYNYSFAEKYNCKVVDIKWDTGNRIYAEWKKI